jgi:hypothetical protein
MNTLDRILATLFVASIFGVLVCTAVTAIAVLFR